MEDATRRAYSMLSQLILAGVRAEDLPMLRAVFGEALAPAPDLDELAADHHALFSFEVFPFEGAFLDPSGLVGGGDLEALYRAIGFSFQRRDVSADHLGVLLAALAHSGDRALYDEHLLRWLPVFAAAVRARGEGFWRLVVELTVELAVEHRRGLGKIPSVPPLSPPTALLEDAETDLRAIARRLTTPCESGWFLARGDVAALGRALDLPRGFGSRRDMMENLLAAAAEYGALPALATALLELLRARDRAYLELAADDTLAPFVAPWREQLARTAELVAAIGRAAQAESSGAAQSGSAGNAPR